MNAVKPVNTGTVLGTPAVGGDAGSSKHKVLFVSHEATRTGAPFFLLHLLRWLRRNTQLAFDVLLAKGGPLEKSFAEIATVHTPEVFADNPELLQSYRLVYSNTACNGTLLEQLPCGNVPIITHFHELDMGFNWLGARNMAAVIRDSNHFFACANAVAARIRDVFAVAADRISVHYEMIDGLAIKANAAAASSTARGDFQLPADAYVVTGCGTFDFRKAPDLFLQTAVQLRRRLGDTRPLRFLWIGALNSPELLHHLSEDIRKLGMTDMIRFVGEMPSPHGLLAVSDVFCLTSREDPFPLVMLEAAALGKPVLCFDRSGGASEFCALGGGVAVPYLDTTAMASAAADLLEDAQRRRELGEAAAVLVEKRFFIEAVAPAIWEELQRHLSHGLPDRPFRRPGVANADIYSTWKLAEAPQRVYIESHLSLRDTIKRAKALFKEGHKQAAVTLLLKSVSTAVAHKDPLTLLDTLRLAGEAMSSIEPMQSAYLLAQAQKVLQANPYLEPQPIRKRAQVAK